VPGDRDGEQRRVTLSLEGRGLSPRTSEIVAREIASRIVDASLAEGKLSSSGPRGG
jgi:hypothetical protein